MRLPSKRISDYEAEVRKRQPKVDKLRQLLKSWKSDEAKP